MGCPLVTLGAEAPGALTIIVKDQHTDRPLASVQITIKKREAAAGQTLATDDKGRVVVEMLDPCLYAVNVGKNGFASSYEPTHRWSHFLYVLHRSRSRP